MVEPASVAPNVPTNTISAAGMLMNAAGEVPSIVDPKRRPRMATPIPIAVAAFMAVRVPLAGTSASGANTSRDVEADADAGLAPGPLRLCQRLRLDGRVPAPPGLVQDLRAPLAHGGGHLVGGLLDNDLRPRRKSDDGVGMGLDRRDEVGVEMQFL